jgi:hypothetical protein
VEAEGVTIPAQGQDMTQSEEVKIGKQVSLQTLLSGLQTIALLGSIAGVFLTIGRRDATLDGQGERIRELATITSDLVKLTSALSATDREYAAKIDSIQARIDRLERKP